MSARDLEACGLTEDQRQLRLRNGRLHRLHRGVYAVGQRRLAFEARWAAAVKACGPDAFLSHQSAAQAWGLLPRDGSSPHVTVHDSTPREHPGIFPHRTRTLDDVDVTHRYGMRVSSVPRTLLDLAGVVHPNTLRRAVRESQALDLFDARAVADVLVRVPNRRGARELRRLLAAGHVPTRSELEDVTHELLMRGGFAAPDVNVALDVHGRRIVPDFRWPEVGLILEADGARWHDGSLARQDDAERQAVLESCGERVVRVTWRQVVSEPQRTIRRIAAAGAPTVSGNPS